MQQIGIALFGGQVVIENTFLKRRQRINFLHIGRTARHAGDDPVDFRLIETHQRQHLRGDPHAACRHRIGRHVQRRSGTLAGRQCGQSGLGEQRVNVGLQTGLAQSLDQVDGQQ